MAGVSAIVLAGGKSERMGANKALLPFGKFATLAEYQYRRLLDCGLFESVSFSLKTPFLPFEAPLILDEIALDAPIAAIVAALKAAKTDRVFALAVDTPFFDEFEKLLAIDAKAAIARDTNGAHPLCAIYAKSLSRDFERAIAKGEYAIKAALKNAQIEYVDFDERKLVNLNFRGDYDRALAAFA
ncbi:MAG: NTP transferase domain-containing protein [Helicobacteraceae bacterium]|jgi:molybdopterin-guanine dinucleotide biosynthesis protein A|nr:NTP transferase domain-containing protein [Helicobacteraceae bacterium]